MTEMNIVNIVVSLYLLIGLGMGVISANKLISFLMSDETPSWVKTIKDKATAEKLDSARSIASTLPRQLVCVVVPLVCTIAVVYVMVAWPLNLLQSKERKAK